MAQATTSEMENRVGLNTYVVENEGIGGLIKVKVSIADRIEKKAVITKICESFNAQKIQAIGNILLLYRASKKPNKKLSNIDRAYRIQA